jgi:hypothetical protein
MYGMGPFIALYRLQTWQTGTVPFCISSAISIPGTSRLHRIQDAVAKDPIAGPVRIYHRLCVVDQLAMTRYHRFDTGSRFQLIDVLYAPQIRLALSIFNDTTFT